MSRLIYPFPGGIHPEENKKQTSEAPLATAPLFPLYVVNLNLYNHKQAKLLVKPGEHVLRGQKIAEDEQVMGSALHAPTSGYIRSVESYPVLHKSKPQAPSVVIESDGSDTWCKPVALKDYQRIDKTELLGAIANAGIVGLGGAGFPSVKKMINHYQSSIHTLIVNGAECEPYITADDCLMQTFTDHIIQGIEVVQYLTQAKNVLIGIEDNKPDAIACMTSACAKASVNKHFEVITIPTLYPSGDAGRLIHLLTGTEIPYNKRAVEMGYLCYNVATLAAIGRLIIESFPLTERITTFSGKAFASPQNIQVRVGTLLSDALKVARLDTSNLETLICGGPLMGFSVDDLNTPINKTTNCIIAATRGELNAQAPEVPCIRCGFCADVCPIALQPQQLYMYAKANQEKSLLQHHLFDCIECGACSWSCPSKIPLVTYFYQAKNYIREQNEKRKKAERAKERHEHRQNRLLKLKQEREARRRKTLSNKTLSKENQILIQSALNKASSVPPNAATSEEVSKKRAHQRFILQIKALDKQLEKVQKFIAAATDEKNKMALESTFRQLNAKKSTLQLTQARSNQIELPQPKPNIVDAEL